MSIVCEFIQIFVFTTNYRLKSRNFSLQETTNELSRKHVKSFIMGTNIGMSRFTKKWFVYKFFFISVYEVQKLKKKSNIDKQTKTTF